MEIYAWKELDTSDSGNSWNSHPLVLRNSAVMNQIVLTVHIDSEELGIFAGIVSFSMHDFCSNLLLTSLVHSFPAVRETPMLPFQSHRMMASSPWCWERPACVQRVCWVCSMQKMVHRWWFGCSDVCLDLYVFHSLAFGSRGPLRLRKIEGASTDLEFPWWRTKWSVGYSEVQRS